MAPHSSQCRLIPARGLGGSSSLSAGGRDRRSPMRQQMVFGDSFVEAEIPDRTHIVSPGLSIPLEPVPDLDAAVREALGTPVDLPPLRELARGRRRVTIAF